MTNTWQYSHYKNHVFDYLLKINKYQFLQRCNIKKERRGKDKRTAY